MATTRKKKETPAPAPEAREQTTPVQEEAPAPEAPAPQETTPPDLPPEPDPAPAPAVQDQGGQDAAPEPFTPYEATVAVPLVVIRRGKTPRPKDKPIGTMTRGARVTVTASIDGFAMLSNGTYVKEAYLERKE